MVEVLFARMGKYKGGAHKCSPLGWAANYGEDSMTHMWLVIHSPLADDLVHNLTWIRGYGWMKCCLHGWGNSREVLKSALHLDERRSWWAFHGGMGLGGAWQERHHTLGRKENTNATQLVNLTSLPAPRISLPSSYHLAWTIGLTHRRASN